MRISLHLLTAFRNLRLSLSIFNEVYLLCIWHLSFGIKVWWAKLLKQLSPIYIIENVMFAKGIPSNALQNGPLSCRRKQKNSTTNKKTLNVGDQTMRFTVWRENKKQNCARDYLASSEQVYFEHFQQQKNTMVYLNEEQWMYLPKEERTRQQMNKQEQEHRQYVIYFWMCLMVYANSKQLAESISSKTTERNAFFVSLVGLNIVCFKCLHNERIIYI